MARASAFVLTFAVALAGCGGLTVTKSDASTFWRQSVARHYHGVVATDDGRGCAKASTNHYACTAYVRNAQNSLSSGRDVIGRVTVSGGNMSVHAHTATGAEIHAWFAKYGPQ